MSTSPADPEEGTSTGRRGSEKMSRFISKLRIIEELTYGVNGTEFIRGSYPEVGRRPKGFSPPVFCTCCCRRRYRM